MIKGNESLVESVNSYFLAPFSHNFNMLHCDPNCKTQFPNGFVRHTILYFNVHWTASDKIISRDSKESAPQAVTRERPITRNES